MSLELLECRRYIPQGSKASRAIFNQGPIFSRKTDLEFLRRSGMDHRIECSFSKVPLRDKHVMYSLLFSDMLCPKKSIT